MNTKVKIIGGILAASLAVGVPTLILNNKEPAPEIIVEPGLTPAPQETLEPTAPETTIKPTPEVTELPTTTPNTTVTPEPTQTPKPTSKPTQKPTTTPKPTQTPKEVNNMDEYLNIIAMETDKSPEDSCAILNIYTVEYQDQTFKVFFYEEAGIGIGKPVKVLSWDGQYGTVKAEESPGNTNMRLYNMP